MIVGAEINSGQTEVQLDKSEQQWGCQERGHELGVETPSSHNSTDLGLFRVLSLGLPRATRGPGGGWEASTGGIAAFLSLFPALSFFSGLVGVAGFVASSPLVLPVLSLFSPLSPLLLLDLAAEDAPASLANERTEMQRISVTQLASISSSLPSRASRMDWRRVTDYMRVHVLPSPLSSCIACCSFRAVSLSD